MFKKHLYLIVPIVILTSYAAYADDYYFEPSSLSPLLLSPPPAENSKEWNDEVKEIIKLQATASKNDLETAEEESTLDINAISPALGTDITETSHPKTYLLLKKLGSTCKQVVHNAKDYWKTKRPFMVAREKGVKELITPPRSYYSYPSGHTACSRVWAESLSQIVPVRQTALREKAARSGYYRVIGGMHWPHDVKAGENLALIIFGALQQSESYRNDLEAAKGEW